MSVTRRSTAMDAVRDALAGVPPQPVEQPAARPPVDPAAAQPEAQPPVEPAAPQPAAAQPAAAQPAPQPAPQPAAQPAAQPDQQPAVQPAQDKPGVFDPAAIQARFTQNPPAAPAPSADPLADIPEVPPAQGDGEPDPKAHHRWAELRTVAKQYQQEAETRRREAEQAREEARRAAEEQARLAGELEERRSREDELVERIGRLSLSESPEFQKKYGLRLEAIKTRMAQALVKFAGVAEQDAAASADKILSAAPGDLPDMLSDLAPTVAGTVMAYANDAASVMEERDQELANWRSTGAAAQYEETRRSAAERAAERRAWADQAVAAAAAYGSPVYGATDPEAREEASRIADAFRGFAQTATEEQLVRAAAEGFAAVKVYGLVESLSAEVGELRTQLAGRVRAGNPPVFPTSGSPHQAPPPPLPPNVVAASSPGSSRDMADSVARGALAGLGLVRQ